jgi:ceramide glucosyltransferase
VPGGGFWPLLESIGMNGEFWGGILAARLIEGMNFAVGPTMAMRRHALEAVGGFEAVRDYLAEDFVLGRRIHEKGYRAALSKHVVEHRIGGGDFSSNMRHRLRWCRGTRRSRPAGYIGQVFTNPIPAALMLTAVTRGAGWAVGLLCAALLLRLAMQLAVARGVLGDTSALRTLPLVPLQDIASFIIWLAAFFGKTIVWRGRVFELLRDGRLRLLGNSKG